MLEELCKLNTETSPISHVTVSEYTIESLIMVEVQGSKYDIVNVAV